MRMMIVGLMVFGCAGAAERGSLELAPDEVTDDVTREWAARWSAATGIEISVTPQGVPVRAPLDIDGASCALTELQGPTPVAIEVAQTPPLGCPGWGYSLGRAIGYALAGRTDVVANGDSSLMTSDPGPGRVYRIDEATLRAVCQYAACVEFLPE